MHVLAKGSHAFRWANHDETMQVVDSHAVRGREFRSQEPAQSTRKRDSL